MKQNPKRYRVRYRVYRIATAKVLFRILERRNVKGRWQWVCIAIGSGKSNAASLEKRLNR